MDINIEFRGNAFYYDTTSGTLYHFKTPNEDVAVAKNVLQKDVLSMIISFCDEWAQDLQTDMNSIRDTIEHIQNETVASDIMQEIVTDLESRYEDLKLQLSEMN